jgi:transposase InsO family protein
MGRDTEKFCNSCRTCQTTKRTIRRQPGLLHPLPTPETPWSSIAMDFMGPFPTSLGYDYLWVILCRLMSNIHLIPIRTTTKALELAFVFLCKVIRLHGLPTSIVSDQDSKFMSKFWHELHRILGVRLRFTMAFHPQADGQVERMIQNVVQILCAMCQGPALDSEAPWH